MRIGAGALALQAAGVGSDARIQRLRARQADSARAAAPGTCPGPRLPPAVADRLADLMASDPGLAAAVTARLPAARRDSAIDLAAYTSSPVRDRTRDHALDISG